MDNPGDLDLTCIENPELRRRSAAALAVDSEGNRLQAPRRKRTLFGGDGRPWDEGNLFLRKVRGKSIGTQKQYAGKLRIWKDTAEVDGTDPMDMTYDALEEYRDEVRMDLSQYNVIGSTWEIDLAAFYAFAKAHGLDTDMWEDLRIPNQSVRWPVVVDQDRYTQLTDTGLRGMALGTNRPGPAAESIQTPLRDTVYADHLLLHGDRRAEAAYLILLDLPERRTGRSHNPGYLPPNICKWGSGRVLHESSVWADRLKRFHDLEWPRLVAEAQRTFRRKNTREELLVVTAVKGRFEVNTEVNIAGLGWRSIVGLSKEDRTMLVMTADVCRRIGREVGRSDALKKVKDDWLIPLAIFPGTRSPMVSPEGWGQTFRDANERVRDAVMAIDDGVEPVRITPHILRHTYAVNWMVDRISEARENPNADHEDKVLRLSELLGHKRKKTTEIYLTYVQTVHEPQMAFSSLIEWVLDREDGTQ